MLAACHSITLAALWSVAGLSTRAPSARYVATTSSLGSRTLRPWALRNAEDATSAWSTGLIAVSLRR